MSVVRSLVVNTAARSAAELINRGGAAVFWIIVARSLGASALGSLAFALSLYNFFITLATLGLGAVVVRDVARDRSKAGLYYSHVLLINSAAALLSALLMIVIARMTTSNSDTRFAVFALAAAMMPSVGFMVGRSLLFAVEQMPRVTIARLAENAFKVTVGLAALQLGAGMRTVAVILAVSKTLPMLVQLPFVHRIAQPVLQPNPELLRRLLRQIPAFSLITVFNSLFWTAPVVLLTRLSGEAQAGIFSAGYKLIDLTIAFANAYGQALFPIASRSIRQNAERFRELFVKSIKYLFIVTAAAAAALCLTAEQIVQLLYGSALADVVPVLRLSAWMIVPFSVVPVLSSTLVGNDLQKRDLAANAMAAAVAAAVTVALAVPLGARSAAVAYGIGCLLFALIEWIGVYQGLFRFRVAEHLWKPAVGVVLFSLCVSAGKTLFLPVNLLLSAACYAVFLLSSGAVTRAELQKIKWFQTA